MHPIELKKQLVEWTMENAMGEERRYLGMSSIGQCPRKLYFDMVNGADRSTQLLHYSYLGYLFEADIKKRLAGIDAKLLGPSEEFIDFGGRFQGHSDGSWGDDLLEIKSTTEDKIYKVIEAGLSQQHRYQVQSYLHYSGREYAHVIYVARDTGMLYVVGVKADPAMAREIKAKAELILTAVDERQPPACECTYCRK